MGSALHSKRIALLVIVLVGVAALVAYAIDLRWQHALPKQALAQSAQRPFQHERYTITFERTGCLGYCRYSY